MVTGGFHTLRNSENGVNGHCKLIFPILVFLLTTAGCSFKWGTMPPTDVVETTLNTKIESKGDILKLLGKPRGYGMTRFPQVSENPYSIWFYEYFESSMSGKMKLKMLLVFFDQDKYGGHIWFHAATQLKSK
jgi:hypothetical protein